MMRNVFEANCLHLSHKLYENRIMNFYQKRGDDRDYLRR